MSFDGLPIRSFRKGLKPPQNAAERSVDAMFTAGAGQRPKKAPQSDGVPCPKCGKAHRGGTICNFAKGTGQFQRALADLIKGNEWMDPNTGQFAPKGSGKKRNISGHRGGRPRGGGGEGGTTAAGTRSAKEKQKEKLSPQQIDDKARSTYDETYKKEYDRSREGAHSHKEADKRAMDAASAAEDAVYAEHGEGVPHVPPLPSAEEVERITDDVFQTHWHTAYEKYKGKVPGHMGDPTGEGHAAALADKEALAAVEKIYDHWEKQGVKFPWSKEPGSEGGPPGSGGSGDPTGGGYEGANAPKKKPASKEERLKEAMESLGKQAKPKAGTPEYEKQQKKEQWWRYAYGDKKEAKPKTSEKKEESSWPRKPEPKVQYQGPGDPEPPRGANYEAWKQAVSKPDEPFELMREEGAGAGTPPEKQRPPGMTLMEQMRDQSRAKKDEGSAEGGKVGPTGKQADLDVTGAGKKAAAGEGKQLAGEEKGEGRVVGPSGGGQELPKPGTPEFDQLKPEYQFQAIQAEAMAKDPEAFRGGYMTPRAERTGGPSEKVKYGTGEMFASPEAEHWAKVAGPAAYQEGMAEAQRLGFTDPIYQAQYAQQNWMKHRAAYDYAKKQGIPVEQVKGNETALAQQAGYDPKQSAPSAATTQQMTPGSTTVAGKAPPPSGFGATQRIQPGITQRLQPGEIPLGATPPSIPAAQATSPAGAVTQQVTPGSPTLTGMTPPPAAPAPGSQNVPGWPAGAGAWSVPAGGAPASPPSQTPSGTGSFPSPAATPEDGTPPMRTPSQGRQSSRWPGIGFQQAYSTGQAIGGAAGPGAVVQPAGGFAAQQIHGMLTPGARGPVPKGVSPVTARPQPTLPKPKPTPNYAGGVQQSALKSMDALISWKRRYEQRA